jgi:hypothetical protein
LQVIGQHREQLLWAARLVSLQDGGVDAAEPQPPAGRDREQAADVQVVVADDRS